ncbi:bifunctional diguanylate cyclase/phosphodiesterase [Sphingomonas jatrophae]|uniref:Diguanylate cyclase (GGDEF) domain-containing protein n=1 Tax=Sphingomonas jatrophae TaxID=1166337 RepID=A0A1I6LGB7_9SPHN|nr:bifunctional diguanylate cyclase/phosphodiesterase [Sphingomonas jatrophae]SFS02565.1 diguanylate cyclase (GGDEF) domain-containing protein [Sphingomonas jatrophae]
MLRVYACIATEHDIRLVLVAAVICLFASCTAFALARQMRPMRGGRRTLWLAALAFVTGTGIWATHFIAMLAFQPHMPTGYAPGLTLLSILIAITVTGFAWQVALNRGGTLLPALLFTAGIATMHFTGMAALQIGGRIDYDLPTVAIAALLGWLFAAVSVDRFRRHAHGLPIVPALLFVGAICVLHFGAMSAASIRPDPSITISASAVETSTLAIAIGSLVVLILGLATVSVLTEARLVRNAAEEAERLKRFTESGMEGLAILDRGRIVDANRIFWGMLGVDPTFPPTGLELAAIMPGAPARPDEADGPLFREAELLRPDGGRLSVDVARRLDRTRGQRRDMVVLRDISERKAAAARIAHLAAHDPLTGAANRLAFSQVLDETILRSSIDAPVAMLCLDLDRFKSVNDIYGHPAGDTLLVEATRRVRACLGADEILARLGGDEFVILQPPGDQPSSAGLLAERVCRTLAEPFEIGAHRIQIGASVGIALHPIDADSAEELHRKADVALYRAKAEARGTARFFDAEMDEQLLRRHRMEAELRGAAQAGELHLHYQPLASTHAGEIVGFEALLRWRSPTFGDVPPAAFIPLAEESGAIVDIGEWVLREACREAASWVRPLKIAVNLSPLQFACGDLVDTVERVLAETGLEAHRLDLEITEGVLIKDADRALDVLTRLKGLGASIAMDDFGTGYSSLSYFRTFPFDKVKIDQSFIRDMATSPQAMAIVRAVIGLGKTLDMAVLAEGVETLGQMDMLQHEGCALMQGYAISRPAPIAAFDALLRAPTADPLDRRVAA